jgi:hypothetical protein
LRVRFHTEHQSTLLIDSRARRLLDRSSRNRKRIRRNLSRRVNQLRLKKLAFPKALADCAR